MKKTTRPDALAALIAARQSAAERAAAQPKRKRKPSRSRRREQVPVIAAPPIETRGRRELARLGQALELEPKVAARRRELDDFASLMTRSPRSR